MDERNRMYSRDLKALYPWRREKRLPRINKIPEKFSKSLK